MGLVPGTGSGNHGEAVILYCGRKHPLGVDVDGVTSGLASLPSNCDEALLSAEAVALPETELSLALPLTGL